MSVKTTQPTNKQHDFWRKLYVRLLTEELDDWNNVSPADRDLGLGAIEDLVDAGYMAGRVIKDASGIPAAATIRGPTLAGRIFAEEQQDILDKKSLKGRIKSGTGLFVGWLVGIISSLIVWRLTR